MSRKPSKHSKPKPPPEPAPEPGVAPPPRPRSRLAAWLLVLAGVIGGGIAAWRLLDSPTGIEVVKPAGFDQLEPRLRDHLARLVALAEESPHDELRHVELGLAYAANGLWEEAWRSFELVERLSPGTPEPGHYMSICAVQLGEIDRGLSLLEEVTRQHPDFAPGLYRLGDLLLNNADLSGAESVFRRVIDAAPSSPEGYFGLGSTMLQLGKYQEAGKFATQGLRIRPGDRTGHYLLGLALRKLGKIEDAERELALGKSGGITYMEDAWSPRLTRHEMSLEKQGKRAMAMLRDGRARQAVAVLEEALRWHPDDATTLNNLASAYIEIEEHDKAEKILMHALGLDERAFYTQSNLAALALRTGQIDKAIEHADIAIAAEPTNPAGYIRKSVCFIRMTPAQYSDARKVLEAGLRYAPEDPDLLFRIGNVCRILQQYKDAKTYFEKTLELDPARLMACVRLGAVCLELEKLEEARRALELAKRLNPNHPDVKEMERRISERSR